ncbi:hypothetical protein JW926_06140, partial [Candidatus Sumerlaeota bacterium]|nr:hypothetical protein [Candidatus Sumerlaeota bacterium]
MKFPVSGWFIVFGVLMFSFSETGAAEIERPIIEHCGNMTFSYTRSGASLEVFDIPFMKDNSLWVITPNWKVKYYQVDAQKDLLQRAAIEEIPNGKKITIFHEMPPEYDCPFKGTQTFLLTRDNTFTATLDFTFSKEAPAVFEWGIGHLNHALLIGKSFTTTDDKQTTTAIIPAEA